MTQMTISSPKDKKKKPDYVTYSNVCTVRKGFYLLGEKLHTVPLKTGLISLCTILTFLEKVFDF